MSIKTLLFAVGALALAACDSPTEPMTADLEALVLPPPELPALPQRIAFQRRHSGNNWEIYRMTPDGSGVVRLTYSAGVDANPVLSPDGSKIAFTSDRDGDSEIYVMNAKDGFGLRQLTYNLSYDGQPTWSPDGSQIAFVSDRDAAYPYYRDIYIINVETGQLVRRLYTFGSDSDPAWRPNGPEIAFVNSASGKPDIFVRNLEDNTVNGLRRLTTDGQGNQHPAWSLPDGSRIAYTGNLNLLVMNSQDGSGRSCLACSFDYFEGEPAWSPDGSKIAFTFGYRNIRVMNVTDRSVIQLTNNIDGEASWAPFHFGF